jgi:hypothetical protein
VRSWPARYQQYVKENSGINYNLVKNKWTLTGPILICIAYESVLKVYVEDLCNVASK